MIGRLAFLRKALSSSTAASLGAQSHRRAGAALGRVEKRPVDQRKQLASITLGGGLRELGVA
eukprot:CAMPEP_0181211118 /NCGR_PEP_ID=MMETSP1096-20121128/23610_1 /TAXON_ID=156174 ORGANISM="Chrysochromulina ericina, Strain CCMP281" /NCGR_SAMPLE_ID=MMETSP1096 /ASSEMBLY_ACC=CAM_ASM_000453 /LENGTH=61 /DNA_ID=CAMNT_0023302487 /DNA_START=704 /DNA_END=889 /DNA_ORIENTATION=-